LIGRSRAGFEDVFFVGEDVFFVGIVVRRSDSAVSASTASTPLEK
jgi:hypothetical protein